METSFTSPLRILGTLKRLLPTKENGDSKDFPEVISLTEIEHFFGRNEVNSNGIKQIRFNKMYFSGTHTQIYLKERDGNIYFTLLDSSANGTFVNNELVGKGNEVEISSGDVITFFKPKPRLKGILLQFEFEDLLPDADNSFKSYLLMKLQNKSSNLPTRTHDQTGKGVKRQRLDTGSKWAETSGVEVNMSTILNLQQQLVEKTVSEKDLALSNQRLEKAKQELFQRVKEEEDRTAQYLSQNRALTDEIAHLKKELAEHKTTANDIWQKQLTHAEERVQSLKQELETERKKSSEKGLAAAKLQSEAETVGRSRAELEKLVGLLQEDKAKLEQKCAEVAAKMIAGNEEQQALQHQVRVEAQKAKTITAQLAQAQMTEKVLREKNSALEIEKQGLVQKELQLEGHLDALREEVKLSKSRAQQVEELKVQSAQLTSALESKSTEASRLQADLVSAQTSLQKGREDTINLQEECRRLKEDLGQKSSDLEKSRAELVSLKDELHGCQRKMGEMGGNLYSGESHQRQLRFELDEALRVQKRTQEDLLAAREIQSKMEKILKRWQIQLVQLQTKMNSGFKDLTVEATVLLEAQSLHRTETQVIHDTQQLEEIADEENTIPQESWLTQEKGISGSEIIQYAQGLTQPLPPDDSSGIPTPMDQSPADGMAIDEENDEDTQEEGGRLHFSEDEALEEKNDEETSDHSADEEKVQKPDIQKEEKQDNIKMENMENLDDTQEEPGVIKQDQDREEPGAIKQDHDQASHEDNPQIEGNSITQMTQPNQEEEDSDTQPIPDLTAPNLPTPTTVLPKRSQTKEPPQPASSQKSATKRSQSLPVRRSTRLASTGKVKGEKDGEASILVEESSEGGKDAQIKFEDSPSISKNLELSLSKQVTSKEQHLHDKTSPNTTDEETQNVSQEQPLHDTSAKPPGSPT